MIKMPINIIKNPLNIHQEYVDIYYLLSGFYKHHQHTPDEIQLSPKLRNIIEELVSSNKAESILFDDTDGYSTLKMYLRHGISRPVQKWGNKDLVYYFLNNFEFIQDSKYLEDDVKCFLKSLKQECDNFFTPIEKTKYYKQGVDYFG
jgi:hypothetical protein